MIFDIPLLSIHTVIIPYLFYGMHRISSFFRSSDVLRKKEKKKKKKKKKKKIIIMVATLHIILEVKGFHIPPTR